MFSFDLPFIFILGIIFGKLGKNQKISRRSNLLLALCVLFIFQIGGLLLWMNVFLGSKEFMIIPFQLVGFTTHDFEPFIAPILFSLEPPLIVMGEALGFKDYF